MLEHRATILVPIDFGDASRAASEEARRLAAALDADIVVLHVHAIPNHGDPGMAGLLFPALREEIAVATEREIRAQGLAEGAARVVLRDGDAAECILEAIGEMRPRLVVMGTHGRKGVARLVLGSVAEAVLRRSAVPVVVVPSSRDTETR